MSPRLPTARTGGPNGQGEQFVFERGMHVLSLRNCAHHTFGFVHKYIDRWISLFVCLFDLFVCLFVCFFRWLVCLCNLVLCLATLCFLFYVGLFVSLFVCFFVCYFVCLMDCSMSLKMEITAAWRVRKWCLGFFPCSTPCTNV